VSQTHVAGYYGNQLNRAVLGVLQRIGRRRPYFDIHGDDGSLYMGRWWLFGGSNPRRDGDEDRPVARTWRRGRLDSLIGAFLAARLHWIARRDLDRDHHNHPATFISVVIWGWYRERRPKHQRQCPTLDPTEYIDTLRGPWSIAYRAWWHRHTITEVSPGGCWTVQVWLPKSGNRWGFFLSSTGAFVDSRDYTVAP
jgi:hypothetical protein